MKESFPIETALFANEHGLIEEPAFAWWCNKVLRIRKRIVKKNRVISGAKTKYWMKTHKYGVRLPKSIAQALEFDLESGTYYWAKAIAKEMKNNLCAFEFNEEDTVPTGHTSITCHMVFDVKLGSLARKARLCGDGHKVPTIAK